MLAVGEKRIPLAVHSVEHFIAWGPAAQYRHRKTADFRGLTSNATEFHSAPDQYGPSRHWG